MNTAYFNSPVGCLKIDEDGVGISSIQICEDLEKPVSNHTYLLDSAVLQLKEYFDGKRKQFDLPLSLQGTPFQLKVWQELLNVPYGETRTYSDIAKLIHSPNASRAVGGANNKNPVMIVVPCHRIIGKNGSLTGYAGGLGVKQFLLNLEGGI